MISVYGWRRSSQRRSSRKRRDRARDSVVCGRGMDVPIPTDGRIAGVRNLRTFWGIFTSCGLLKKTGEKRGNERSRLSGGQSLEWGSMKSSGVCLVCTEKSKPPTLLFSARGPPLIISAITDYSRLFLLVFVNTTTTTQQCLPQLPSASQRKFLLSSNRFKLWVSAVPRDADRVRHALTIH
jgi:hypothetical protein